MDLAEKFTDIVMEAPHGFSVSEKSFLLYPISLGKMILMQRQLENMGIQEEHIAQSSILEIMRIVSEHREQCLRLIAYMTCENKSQCYDTKHIERVIADLSEITDEDVATLLIYITASDKTSELTKYYGIDKERECLNSVMRVKSDKNSMSFGGKTLLGALIDPACERYGWTLDYVIWGISYAALRLLMSDKINTIYLSDDERKKVPSHILNKDDDVIKATKENMEEIKSMNWR